MVLLKGSGLALKFGHGEARVLRQIGEVAEFDGAVATQCELLDGLPDAWGHAGRA